PYRKIRSGTKAVSRCCGWPRSAALPTRTYLRRRRVAARCARLGSAQRFASPSRARSLLLFRLRAGSWLWCCRKSDDFGYGIRSTSMASAACGRGTWNVLVGLIGDKFVEIGVGEHATHALTAMADVDITQRAGSDVLA